jgi:hypothetical protein
VLIRHDDEPSHRQFREFARRASKTQHLICNVRDLRPVRSLALY